MIKEICIFGLKTNRHEQKTTAPQNPKAGISAKPACKETAQHSSKKAVYTIYETIGLTLRFEGIVRINDTEKITAHTNRPNIQPIDTELP